MIHLILGFPGYPGPARKSYCLVNHGSVLQIIKIHRISSKKSILLVFGESGEIFVGDIFGLLIRSRNQAYRPIGAIQDTFPWNKRNCKKSFHGDENCSGG